MYNTVKDMDFSKLDQAFKLKKDKNQLGCQNRVHKAFKERFFINKLLRFTVLGSFIIPKTAITCKAVYGLDCMSFRGSECFGNVIALVKKSVAFSTEWVQETIDRLKQAKGVCEW
uniref:Uncharacterized protein n=1 Tax=Romanomermis culicivorax TaxID=13658 RepID=A0A915I408_ROMCU